MEKIALNTKKEMTDFVAFYRRFTNVAGKQSFSTLYATEPFGPLLRKLTERRLPQVHVDKRTRWPLYELRPQVPSAREATQTPIPGIRRDRKKHQKAPVSKISTLLFATSTRSHILSLAPARTVVFRLMILCKKS